MSAWLESIAARCRGGEKWNEQLANADIIWEDSVLGESGYAFVIGIISDKYFYAKWEYDTYQKQDYAISELNIFPTIENLKAWLRELKEQKHPKATEILAIMKFLLT